MPALLRALAFPIACAFTGAAAGLLTVQLMGAPAPTCPQGPVLELKQVATALAGMQVVPPPPAAVEEPPFPDGAVRHIAGDDYAVDRDAFAALFSKPDWDAHQVRILPSIRDGVTQGFKLYGIRPGSLPKRIGMKNGDLLVAVNGARVVSFDEYGALRRLLPTADRIHLDIVRKGEPVRITLRLE